MAFDGLGDKLQDIFKRMKGQGKISEKDLKAVMREVKVALLEADVNYKVVKQFIDKINSRAVGEEVMESLTPGQQVVKIVHEELTELLGGSQSKLTISPKPPTVVMMVGLQGSGKTTTTGKIGPSVEEAGETSSFGSLRRIPSSCNQATAGIGRAIGDSRIFFRG